MSNDGTTCHLYSFKFVVKRAKKKKNLSGPHQGRKECMEIERWNCCFYIRIQGNV